MKKLSKNKPLIPLKKSIIPACDMADINKFEELVKATCDINGIGGYKVGIELVIPYGLTEVVKRARKYTKLPIILDWQKAGNDIPEMGAKFAAESKKAGVEAVILFPFTGPASESAWIEAAQKEGLTVIVGGHMTHPQFLESAGGSISDSAPSRIYTLAAKKGVRDFVVPGNQPDLVAKYKELLEDLLGKGKFTLYAPGFVAQGGSITEAGEAAGERFHAIVGRHIVGAQDMKKAAKELTSQLKSKTAKNSKKKTSNAREDRVMQILRDTGAFLDGHFLLKSGKHSDKYVNKDRIYPHTKETAELARMMAEDVKDYSFDIVVGPEKGGIILSNNIASELTKILGRDIPAVFAEKAPEGGFVFTRGYGAFVKGKKVLIVEDILTTGSSVIEVVKTVKAAGGKVTVVEGIVNRGTVTAKALGVAKFKALIDLNIPAWEANKCKLCKARVPIDNQVGHGKKASK